MNSFVGKIQSILDRMGIIGGHQSKEELVYQQVNCGNIEGIKSLRREGAGLEWLDKEGKTPLMLACMRPDLLNVAKVLIELGANVNAYRPGWNAGTPLHHAAKEGLEETVNLLLSSGANPLVINDAHQTPLDVARKMEHCNVVHAIEVRICLFCGWLRELKGRRLPFAQQVQKKIWAVVLPCDSRNPTAHRKFELAIYPNRQASEPRTIVLSEAQVEEPKFSKPDPTLCILDKASETKYKFRSALEGDKSQLEMFYNACRGISQQQSHDPVAPPGAAPTPSPSYPSPSASAAAAPAPVHTSAPEDVQMSMAVHASIQSALAEGVPIPNPQPINLTTHTNGWGAFPDNTTFSGWGQSSGALPATNLVPAPDPCNGVRPSSSSPQLHTGRLETPTVLPSAHEVPPTIPVPSAPPINETFYSGPVQYPTIDSSPVDLTVPPPDGSGSSSSCVICLAAPVEGAFDPCGHMVGCLSCLGQIKRSGRGCPVCRAKITKVIKLYAV